MDDIMYKDEIMAALAVLASDNYYSDIKYDNWVDAEARQIAASLNKIGLRISSLEKEIQNLQSALSAEASERIRIEGDMAARHMLLLNILENMGDLVLVSRTDSKKILFANKNAVTFFDFDAAYTVTEENKTLLNKIHSFIVSGNDREQEFFDSEFSRWYAIKNYYVEWAQGEYACLQWVRDITRINQRVAELERYANIDSLTGAFNARVAGIHLSALMEETRRSLCVVYIDMDNLKLINDQFGHGEGDNAIKSLTDLMRKAIRSNDLLCRLGGDEFLLILPECTTAMAAAIEERIQRSIAAFNSSDKLPFNLSMSCGIAVFEKDTGVNMTAQELINIADTKMYEVKVAKKKHCSDLISKRR